MSDTPLTVIRPVGQMDISIADEANPRSVLNLVAPVVREAIKRVPAEFHALSEKELEKLTPKQAFTVVDRRLRTAFWIEYGRAQDANQAMNMTAIYGGICSRPYFYTSVLQDRVRLAYLLTQPTDYKIAMEEALSFGVDKLREILEMPLYDPQGRPDSKVADIVLKTVALIDQRVKGGVVQKVHQINQSVGSQGKPAPEPANMAEIDRKLAELEAKVGSVKRSIITAEDIVIEEPEKTE